MSETFQISPLRFQLRNSVSHCLLLSLMVFGFFFPVGSKLSAAPEASELESALVKLVEPHEKAGFDFRADIWERELAPEVGKAARVQMFKGNEYRVCLAVPPSSGVQITAHVLDIEGKPIESKTEVTENGWGIILHVKPKHTGIFLIAVRNAGGKSKTVTCAMVTGYR